MSIYSQFVDAALSYQGCHYIWGGKGHLIFNGTKLVPHKFTRLDDATLPLEVFDCSGLVTQALLLATTGFIDLRASHSAKTILDTFPECDADFGDGCLLLYPGHVAIDIGRGRVVDARGGTHTTTSIGEAERIHAAVQIHKIDRNPKSLLGYRRIPTAKTELKK